MAITWIDAVIFCIVIYYIYGGWERGLATILAELLSFLISLWVAVRYHSIAGSFITEKFGIAPAWTDILGYIALAFVAEMLLVELFMAGLSRVPEKILASKMNHIFGGIASAINALVIISFFLLLALSLPLRGTIKSDIGNSRVANFLVRLAEQYGGNVTSSVEQAAKQAVTFLTIEPGSKEQLPINVPQGLTLTVDSEQERQMIEMVNRERTSRGLQALSVDPRLTDVARGKSRDMFDRRYFSHYDPDGKNAADRANAAGIPYNLIGENLAYAPDLATAHEGLMNSEGHRANILETRYGRIGIGIIRSTYYGTMFTQLFAD